MCDRYRRGALQFLPRVHWDLASVGAEVLTLKTKATNVDGLEKLLNIFLGLNNRRTVFRQTLTKQNAKFFLALEPS